MSQIRSTGWSRHITIISTIGGALALFGALVPSCHIIESDLIFFLWYFGFYYMNSIHIGSTIGMVQDFVNPGDVDKYMTIGITVIVLSVLAMIIMFIAANQAKYRKRKPLAAGMSLVGGILALIAPLTYYFYVKEIRVFSIFRFWDAFDLSFGFYILIVAGIIGILGAVGFIYAYIRERRKEISTNPQQLVDQPTTEL